MPANPLKGEFGFTCGGVEYVLVYTVDALCALEDRLNMSVVQIGEAFGGDPRLTFLRIVFHAGLHEYHPDLTPKQAGELMQAYGLEKAGNMVGTAFMAAFGEPEAGAATADPQTAPEPAAV
jgi:hypothetical protein